MPKKRIFQKKNAAQPSKTAAHTHPKNVEVCILSGIGRVTTKLMILLVPMGSISTISLVVIGP